jgi:sulfatase maturation enzyme AslB (radical SAM superfamily)
VEVLQELNQDKPRAPKKSALNFNGLKFTRRAESWGQVIYDFEKDLFSAQAKHGVRLATIEPEAPLGLYWLVTAPCNLKCIHCYGNVEDLPKGLTSEQAQIKIADRIIESGAMRVTINGGEPLLRRDTPAIIEQLADADVSVILGTNGTYLTTAIMPSVKRTTRIEISFDSHLENVNNSIRVSRLKDGNAYKESLAAVDLALAHDVRLRVLTCLNRHNYQHVEAIGDLLYARGVRDWSVSWTLHAGRARHIYSSLVSPDMQSVESVIDLIRLKYPDMKIKYSNRSEVAEGNNRFSCLVFPDGRMFAEDLDVGEKIAFHSLLQAPVSQSWNNENYNIRQHFKRWVGDRMVHFRESLEVSEC